MLSAAGSSQSSTTKRHLENLSRPSSYVQFEKPQRPLSGRMDRHSSAQGCSSISSPIRAPDEPLAIKYEPTSSLETLALALEMESKVAKRALENEEIQESAMSAVRDSELQKSGGRRGNHHQHPSSASSDIGREHRLCSSPRGQLSEADRRRVLDNIETSHHFAECLISQGPRIQGTLSPPRERNSPRVTLDLRTTTNDGEKGRTITCENDNDDLTGKEQQQSPRQSSCFASNTARFQTAGSGAHSASHVPPVGHYSARYTVVERSSRSATLRDGRNCQSQPSRPPIAVSASAEEPSVSIGKHRASTSDEAPASPQRGGDDVAPREGSQQPRYASPRRQGGAPNSARQRTRQRLAETPATTKVRPTSAFASTVPQLHFHTLHMKMHTQRESDDEERWNDPGSSLTAPRHNDSMLSTTPRVQSASKFHTMRGRNGEAFQIHSAAPEDVLVYEENVPFSERKVAGSIEFIAQSTRKLLYREGLTTSVDDANLRTSDASISPRVVSVPSFDRGSKRGGNGGNMAVAAPRDKQIPVTVGVELIPDRRNLFTGVDKHQLVPALAKMGRAEFISTAENNRKAAAVTSTEPCGGPFTEGGVAQPFPRAPNVNFQMHSSHHDTTSFAKLPEKRLAHGDFPSTGVLNPPEIDPVRPRFVKNINLRAMTSRDDHASRAARDAEEAANRPILEAPDSPLRHPRVTGNPHIAAATTREQRSKKGGLVVPGLHALDKFYDVSYATSAAKVKLVSSFATQVNRAAARLGNRTIVQTQSNENFPGPGAYL